MTPSQDRAVIKKKIKEMKSSIERARKAQEKMEKQREKLRKKEKEQLQRKSKKPDKHSPDPTDGGSEQWCIRITTLLGLRRRFGKRNVKQTLTSLPASLHYAEFCIP